MQERRHPDRVIAFVMAGGSGTRLRPLTDERCKPAVPFGSRYRIVDFVLSNLVNSGLRSIYLLVQYKPQSLIEHIRRAWVVSPLIPDQFVTVVPPEMSEGAWQFKGTADAVFQSLRLIEQHRPSMVAVFGADHVYRMDVRQMIWHHREARAEVSVAALPVPLDEASDFGVLETDMDGRILAFHEKPKQPKSMPDDPERAYASMGNYLFDAEVLKEALVEADRRGETDFGGDVLPRLIRSHRVHAYDFATNDVPGIRSSEEAGYWRDVGTVDAYFAAHQDVLGDEPLFEAFNPQWPIFSSNYQGPVSKILGGEIENSLFGAACVVHRGAKLKNCIVRRETVIFEDAELEDCVIMDYSCIGKGAKLRRVIVDRHNEIPAGAVIGYDPDQDARQYEVTPGGVVVVPRGSDTYFARNSRGYGLGYAE